MNSIDLSITYPLMEHFYTIQGEGFHQGKAAYFLRLGGCDVGCVWCDVKESWESANHPKTSIEQMVGYVKSTPATLVVITGGEPLLYDIAPLITALQKAGLAVNIETSGAYPLSGKPNWICVSPKKFKAPTERILPVADELKVIVFNTSDFDWAEKYAANVPASCHLYLQPEWDKREEMTPLIIEYIKMNPKWVISLQSHKYIHVP